MSAWPSAVEIGEVGPRDGLQNEATVPVADRIRLIDALSAVTIVEGGRVYLAKDGFVRREDFARMEPRLAAFEAARRRWDPQGQIRSAQSVRLFGDPS